MREIRHSLHHLRAPAHPRFDPERSSSGGLRTIAATERARGARRDRADHAAAPGRHGRRSGQAEDRRAGCRPMCSTLSAASPAPGVDGVALRDRRQRARAAGRRPITNADGRTDAPLIGGEPLRIGTYELQFRDRRLFRGPPGPHRGPAISRRRADPLFRSPSRRAIIMCRCSSRRGAIRPIEEADTLSRRSNEGRT